MVRMTSFLFAVAFALGCLCVADPITAVSGVFTVDRTAPSVPDAAKPVDGGEILGPFLRLEARAYDATSGVAGYEFELVGNDWQALDTPYAVFRGIANGSYTWNVRACDQAGNWSDWATYECGFAFGDDDDNDGLTDTWELACFGRLDYSDGTLDSDGDGISDLLEAEAESHGFEFYLTLQPGWNMVALPCDTTADSAASLLAATESPIWSWNAATLRYRRITASTPPLARTGLWIFAADEIQDIPVSGIPPLDDKLRLERGWNLAGAGLPSVFDSADGVENVQTWRDGGYDLFDPQDFEFELLQGYWIYASEASDQTLVTLDW